MKKFIIVGNWKLNGNNSVLYNFFLKLKNYVYKNIISNTIIIAPPIVYLEKLRNIIKKKNFFLGAQNVDIHEIGPFTGEISTSILKDIGVKYVIIGHSERRMYHKESNDVIAHKFKLLKKRRLIPILCIGENLEEKNKNNTKLVCKKQIDIILKKDKNYAFKNSIIAYEPIWAIGSGKTANPKYVQNIHQFIKNYISKNSNTDYQDINILYGGSVNAENIKHYYIENDINGVLLGGSAIIYEQFIEIIKILNNTKKK